MKHVCPQQTKILASFNPYLANVENMVSS